MWPWPAGGLQVVAVPSIPHQSPHEVAIGASLRHRAAWLCHSAHMLGPEMGTVSLPSGSRRGRRKLLMLQEGKSGAVLGLPESFLSSDSPDSRLRGAFLGSVSCPCQLLWCLSSVSPSPSPFPPPTHTLRAPQPRMSTGYHPGSWPSFTPRALGWGRLLPQPPHKPRPLVPPESPGPYPLGGL